MLQGDSRAQKSTMDASHKEEDNTAAEFQEMESASLEELNQETDDNRTRRYDVMKYLKSSDFMEILACGVFLVLSLVPYMFDTYVRLRPIPYQYLENSNDYVRNQVYNEESQDDTVSNTMLVLLAEILPLVVQFVVAKCFGRIGDAHCTVCVYLVGLGLTLLTTECIKLYVGYLRPIFYDRCEPNDDYQQCKSDEYSSSIRKSFPSGHASTSFCGLLLLTLFVHQRFGVPSIRAQRHQVVGDTDMLQVLTVYTRPPLLYRFLSLAALLPVALAGFIAASRVADNKHFPADVVGGSVLGAAIALFVHGLWFG